MEVKLYGTYLQITVISSAFQQKVETNIYTQQNTFHYFPFERKTPHCHEMYEGCTVNGWKMVMRQSSKIATDLRM